MPSSGKFKVRVAKIIKETSSKFDGLNNANSGLEENRKEVEIG